MEFIRTEITDVVICKPRVFNDPRGYFYESFREDLLTEFLGFNIDFCQDNESMSSKGVLRGLHYQLPPYAQTKLIRVVQGAVLDICVDIRRGSPTFGKHVAIELSAENKLQLLIPRGFAHGFLVLSDTAVFSYKVDNYYNKDHDRGILYNDPDLAIDWKSEVGDFQLSEKDIQQPLLKYADLFDIKTNLYDK